MSWTTPKTFTALSTLPAADLNTHLRDNLNFLKSNIALGAAAKLTIATGEVTKTQTYHSVETEAEAASDDLATINGGSAGDVLILRPFHTDRTVVVKNGTGNIDCDADITMNSTSKFVVLLYDGTNWQLLASR